MSKARKSTFTYEIDDIIYNRIYDRFKTGEFSFGNDLRFTKKRVCEDDLSNITDFDDEFYASLVENGICSLNEVPYKYRTNKFYISLFLDEDIFSYIRDNVDEFDREFFKDLITSSEFCNLLSDRCAFLIMPIEYIDEEMCSLAILHSTWCCASAWFNVVLKRKPSVINEDMWKLAARLYAITTKDGCPFLDIVPDEFKDKEFYEELCLSSYFKSKKVWDSKQGIMNYIPDKMKFEIAKNNIKHSRDSIYLFSDELFDLPANVLDIPSNEVLWKTIIDENGFNIKYIPLNIERINYFTSIYDRRSDEYKRNFRSKMLKYMVSDNNCDFFLPVNCNISGNKKINSDLLREIYDKIGIEIINQVNDILYCVKLPDGWMIDSISEEYYRLVDTDGNNVIEFFISNMPCDKEAYVSCINENIKNKVHLLKKIK